MLQLEIEKRYKSLTVLQEEYKDCTRCELSKTRNNIVFGIGALRNILIVAEAPGEVEDLTGYPFMGQSGQILDYVLARTSNNPELRKLAKTFPIKNQTRNGWKDFIEVRNLLLQEIFYTNSVLCRPPDNRNPTNNEIKACNGRLLETIYQVDPKIIITAGKIALETVMGKKVSSIQKMSGSLLDITLPGKMVEVNYTVMPILHPAFLMRNPDYESKTGIWQTTIAQIQLVRNLVADYDYMTRVV